MLDEVHFPAKSSFSYDKVSRLENLKTQLGEDHCHKMRVSVCKQGHVGHKSTTVVTDYLLQEKVGQNGSYSEIVIKKKNIFHVLMQTFYNVLFWLINLTNKEYVCALIITVKYDIE